MRRYSLYSSARRPSSEFLQQVGQSDQIFVSKEGSSSGNLHERIDSSGIRTTRQNRLQPAFGVAEVHAILAPIIAVFHQFELLSEQGMKLMGYTETFLCIVRMRCD
jgi:hypothetical protein